MADVSYEEVEYYNRDTKDLLYNRPISSTTGFLNYLAGGLNANLIKMVREQAPENAHYITIGRKLNAALAKLNERLDGAALGDAPSR